MKYFLVSVPDSTQENDLVESLTRGRELVLPPLGDFTVTEARYAGDLPKLATAPARSLYVVEREK